MAKPRKPAALRCASARPGRRTSAAAFAGDPPGPGDPLLDFVPYRHRQPRRNTITPDRQRAFIAALAASGIVTQAARQIGASLEALYRLRHLPGAEGFAAAWEAALDRGVARLEDCALELALRGEELPIASGGKLLGTYRKHNFAHIRFVLSQRRAARFGPIAAAPEPAPVAARGAADEAYLERLNRRIEVLRQRALAVGALPLPPEGDPG